MIGFSNHHGTRETGQYYSGREKQRARSVVLEVLFSDTTYTTVVQGQTRPGYGLGSAHDLRPGGEKGLWSYVSNGIPVPREGKEDDDEGRRSFSQVVEPRERLKKASEEKGEKASLP